jgi:carbonic anhydrase/acetyltransferase-like protein (isoleucine patch superfamily)
VDETLETKVRRLAAESALVQTLAGVRRDGGVAYAVGDAPLRRLSRPEIEQLETFGNTCRDWSRVRVADGFNPRRVRNCEFQGDVVLGRFTRRVPLADGVEVTAGLSYSTVADSVIGHNALVRDVRLLANCVVGEEAVLANCGRVTCGAGATFGNGARVPVALEGGGREVELFAELDVDLAATVARPDGRRDELAGYRRAVGEYRERVTSDRGVIGAGARVWNVPRVEDAFIGAAACVDGATAVIRSTLLSTPDQPATVETGALVADSVLQWGVRVTGMAVVERSLVGEASRVERHGKVRNSVLGPNAEVAAGEVSGCLLGPFVGCQHQSLLIATYWPAGRGNVGYGANVGSNHTSRAPDQEFRAGEGLFIGLGVNVKFPCDFSQAVHSVVACGTDLPPQQVTFPFSLVAPPKDPLPGFAPTVNQITPAWMLRENVYALKRSEAKFRARNRAVRTEFEFAVFRRETIDLMLAAARRLADIPAVVPVYTEREIPGLGKNLLTDADRVKAVDAYRFFARHWALLGLRDRLADGAAPDQVLDTPRADPEWEYRCRLLVEEFGITDVGDALRLLGESAQQIARDTERARERDTARGRRIIDDYEEVHPRAGDDGVVRAAWAEARAVREEVQVALRSLARGPSVPEGMAGRVLV